VNGFPPIFKQLHVMFARPKTGGGGGGGGGGGWGRGGGSRDRESSGGGGWGADSSSSTDFRAPSRFDRSSSTPQQTSAASDSWGPSRAATSSQPDAWNSSSSTNHGRGSSFTPARSERTPPSLAHSTPSPRSRYEPPSLTSAESPWDLPSSTRPTSSYEARPSAPVRDARVSAYASTSYSTSANDDGLGEWDLPMDTINSSQAQAQAQAPSSQSRTSETRSWDTKGPLTPPEISSVLPSATFTNIAATASTSVVTANGDDWDLSAPPSPPGHTDNSPAVAAATIVAAPKVLSSSASFQNKPANAPNSHVLPVSFGEWDIPVTSSIAPASVSNDRPQQSNGYQSKPFSAYSSNNDIRNGGSTSSRPATQTSSSWDLPDLSTQNRTQRAPQNYSTKRESESWDSAPSWDDWDQPPAQPTELKEEQPKLLHKSTCWCKYNEYICVHFYQCIASLCLCLLLIITLPYISQTFIDTRFSSALFLIFATFEFAFNLIPSIYYLCIVGWVAQGQRSHNWCIH
jgi:hypothetical protein